MATTTDTAEAKPVAKQTAAQWQGKDVLRKEDDRLLRGYGSFADDVKRHGTGYVHLVRSPYAHAYIKSINLETAQQMPGVYATLTGAEVEKLQQPYIQLSPPPGGQLKDYCMAVNKVTYVGEPVVAIVAESSELARDAGDTVIVDYEELPAVIDSVYAASPESPTLHEEMEGNIAWHGVYEYGEIDKALEEADYVLEIDKLHFHRFTSTPIEGNAAVVEYDRGTGEFTFYCNNQMPQFAAMYMSPALGVPIDRLHFVTKDIGGAFGNKITTYTYLTLLALLAKRTGRPVKWTEWRSEHIAAGAHGNERTFLDVKVPVMKDGRILGFKVKAIDDAGAYTRYEPLGAVIWSQVLTGCYAFKHAYVDFMQVVSNKCPLGPNRGYSRLQHQWLVERIVDITASQLQLDPVEVRKKNYIKSDQMPYETLNGCVYDSGDYERCLQLALDGIHYEEWLARKKEYAQDGQLIGVGIGSTLDSGTNNFGQARIINPYLPFSGNGETSNVKLDLYGEVVCAIGSVPQGQGHETTAAQVVADFLGISPDDVSVKVGHDTRRNVYSGFSGTYASQYAVTGLGAVQGAAERLRAEILELAALRLHVTVHDLEIAGGSVWVAANPEQKLTFNDLANLVYTNNGELPNETNFTLNITHTYKPEFTPPDTDKKFGNLTLTYATQIHACVVSVDIETGQPTILDYVAVDDCGKRINPMIVEGQVHGAAAHGIGAVLYESLTYDNDGQLLNTTFYDYNPITALDCPVIKTDYIESPSPFSPNGAKGMGEGGGAPLHAVCSALQDALSEVSDGIVRDSHNSPEAVYDLLNMHDKSANGIRVLKNHESSNELGE
ncbi:xanthine dehydrogenase family protein molybdopterin-binding subunit [Alicyclobacillus sp. SO9]|uniref:xanthine dehydrogenase family protein molybdopterin-binding subunit n=1 Tax=Alicyclobacillus sp. SO9 TaxID=2665646 RepID=UPI0018E829BE|nr:xanthine dehydrogenase family protein molybdopterin-binding subunit [Alicyclobacillus sp. SO9]QQE80502.1 xanthine dehydrogenase family protein [Alicyclobacillus sp. SO9]